MKMKKYINLILVMALLLSFSLGIVQANDNTGATTTPDTESSAGKLVPNQNISDATSLQEKDADGTVKRGEDGKPVTKVPAGVSSMLGKITGILVAIAGFVCVFKLIQIGIMFVLTGASEKSNAKTALLPWTIGAIVCGGYVTIGDAIISVIQDAAGGGGINGGGNAGGAVETLGQQALQIIGTVAFLTSLGMVIYIGIKYLLAGAGGMAKVKTTVVPLLVGMLIIGSASQIAGAVIGMANNGGDLNTIVSNVGYSVISMLNIVAYGLAIAMLILIAIKYMLKGAGAKAEVKSTLLPWFIGALVVASATTIVGAFLPNAGGGTTKQGDNTPTEQTEQQGTDWRTEMTDEVSI